VDITVTANGPRPRLHPEVLAGLRGEPLGEGLAGRWVQAFYVQAVTADGGGIAVQVGESEAVFRVRVPDD
jgi:histidine phosphotransferase ChpT